MSTVNVTDTSLFPKTNSQSLEAALKAGIGTIASLNQPMASSEYYLMRPSCLSRGITNRMGHFADEAQPYLYAKTSSPGTMPELLWQGCCHWRRKRITG